MISDNLRKLLGKERIDQMQKHDPIKPKYRQHHVSYKLPIDDELFLKGFTKLYKDLYDRDYQMTQESKQLILFFNTDQLNQNAVVIGGTGTGKTSTMCCISHLLIYTTGERFDVHYMPRVSSDFRKHGDSILEVYTRSYACLDDIGAEKIGTYYGNKINLSEDLIETRYNAGIKTHYTTNMKPDELREYLGDRAYSRMKHNSRVFLLSGEDKR